MSESNSKLDVNAHIKSAIDYYKCIDNPMYALFVTGDWGVGKTYTIKKLLNSNEYYYVSLFGCDSTQKIHTLVMSQIFPLQQKITGMAKLLGKSVLKIDDVDVSTDLLPDVIREMIKSKIKPDRILIFDDIERCKLKIEDTLGAINSYIEHHKFNVIMIAHDKVIINKISKYKEKLIGNTIIVNPDISNSFDHFSRLITKDDVKKIVINNKNIIIDIFNLSRVRSLRILRHVIYDLARLLDCLTPSILSNSQAIDEIIKIFLPYDIDGRAGNITHEDVVNRKNYFFQNRSSDDGQSSRISICEKKYDSRFFQTTIIQDSTLADMIFDGFYSKEKIQKDITESFHFARPEDITPWKVAINFLEIDDNLLSESIERMYSDIEKFNYTKPGDILHVASLFLVFSEFKIIKNNPKKMKSVFIKYINTLLDDGLLLPENTNWESEFQWDTGFDGYGYLIDTATKDFFIEIKNHLTNSIKIAISRDLPSRSVLLLELIHNDSKSFHDQLCHNPRIMPPYLDLPVLAHIKPDTFVKSWMKAPYKNWRNISRTLNDRYNLSNLKNSLHEEKDWLESVLNLLEIQKNSQKNKHVALRLSFLFPNKAKNTLNEVINTPPCPPSPPTA